MLLAIPLSGAAEGKSKELDGVNGVETIESFIIDTTSEEPNEEGIFEQTGFKTVNSITIINKKSDNITTASVYALEDYYDLSGTYKYSLSLSYEIQKDYQEGKLYSRESKSKKHEILNRNFVPQTSSNNKGFYIEDSNKDEIKKVILDEMKKLPIGELRVRDVPTRSEIQKMINDANQLSVTNAPLQNPSIQSVQYAGAFDNYYNHYSTGEFVAQALSLSAHNYIKVTGSTAGAQNTKNALTMISFKSHIDKYEEYLITQMNYDAVADLFEWLDVIAGLIEFSRQVMAGPGGWATLVTIDFSEALMTFIDLTSLAYGTYQNVQLSHQAMQGEENARQILFRYYDNFVNYNVSVVRGY